MGSHDSAMYSSTWQILQHYRESVIMEDDESLYEAGPAPPVPPLPNHGDFGKGWSMDNTKKTRTQKSRGLYSLTPESLSPATPRSASPEFGYASSRTSTSSSHDSYPRAKEIRERRSPKGSTSEHWPINLKLTKTNGSTDLEHKALPKWKYPSQHENSPPSPVQVPPIPPKNARRSIEGLPRNPRPDRNMVKSDKPAGLRRLSKESNASSATARRSGPPLKVTIPTNTSKPPVLLGSDDSWTTKQTGMRISPQSRLSAEDQYPARSDRTHIRQQGSYDSVYTDAPGLDERGYHIVGRNYSIDSFGDRKSQGEDSLSKLIAAGLDSASVYGDSPRDSPSSAYKIQEPELGTELRYAESKHLRSDSDGPLTHHNLATPFSQPEMMAIHSTAYDGSVLSPPSEGPRQSFGFGAPLKFSDYDIVESLRDKAAPRRESDVESPLGGASNDFTADIRDELSPQPLRIVRKSTSMTDYRNEPVSRYGAHSSQRSGNIQDTESANPPPPPPKPAGLPLAPKSRRSIDPNAPPLPPKDGIKARKSALIQPQSQTARKIESVRSKLDKSKPKEPSPPRGHRPARSFADMFGLASSPEPASEASASGPTSSREAGRPDSAQQFFENVATSSNATHKESTSSFGGYGGFGSLSDYQISPGPSPPAKPAVSPGPKGLRISSRANNRNRYDLSPASNYDFDGGAPGPTAPPSAVSPAFRSGNNLVPPQSSAFLSPASAAFGPSGGLRISNSPLSPAPASAVTQKHFSCPQQHRRLLPQSNEANPMRCMACWANPTRIWRCGDCGLRTCSSCRIKMRTTRGDLTAVLDLTEADRKPNMAKTEQTVDPQDLQRMSGLSPLTPDAPQRPRAYTSESIYPNQSTESRYGSGRTPVSGNPYHSQASSIGGIPNHERTFSNLSNASSNSSLPVGASAFGRYSSGNLARMSQQQRPPSAGFQRPRQSPGMPVFDEVKGGPYPGARAFPPRAPSSGMSQPMQFAGKPSATGSTQPSPRSMPASSPGLRIRASGGRSPGMVPLNMGGGLATRRSHSRMGSMNLQDGMGDPSAAALSVGGGPYPGAVQSKSIPSGMPANGPQPAPLQMPVPPLAPRGLPMGGPRPGGPRPRAAGGPLAPSMAGHPISGPGTAPPPRVSNGRSLPPGAGFGLPGVPKNIRAGVPGRPSGTMRV